MKEIIFFPKENIINTKTFVVEQDREVPIPGFFIIAPYDSLKAKRELRSITDFTDQEALEFLDLIRLVRTGMRDVLGIKEVYFFQNEDSEHGFHLWIFPRYDWMKKIGIKIQSVRTIINYAIENMAKDESITKKVKGDVKKMQKYMLGKWNDVKYKQYH